MAKKRLHPKEHRNFLISQHYNWNETFPQLVTQVKPEAVRACLKLHVKTAGSVVVDAGFQCPVDNTSENGLLGNDN